MSGKFNAKGLTYDQKLPPFLAALRGQVDARDGPDPILAAHRRPVKKRSASEEAEDAPLVLDEHGDVVAGVQVGVDGAATMKTTGSVDVDEKNGKDGKDDKDDKTSKIRRDESKTDGVAGIGQGKKRKAGKVIGGGGDHDDDDSSSERDTATKANHRKERGDKKYHEHKDAKGDKSTAPSDSNKDKKKKKKAKKIKLSFDDDDEDD